MSKTLDEIKSNLNAIMREVESSLKSAYNKGYLDGLSTDRPTQAQFNKDHAKVQSYGEDQNLLVLSGSYDRETAVSKFEKFLESEWGWSGEELNWAEAETRRSSVSYELYEGEAMYYIRSDRGGIYDCWLCEVEV